MTSCPQLWERRSTFELNYDTSLDRHTQKSPRCSACSLLVILSLLISGGCHAVARMSYQVSLPTSPSGGPGFEALDSLVRVVAERHRLRPDDRPALSPRSRRHWEDGSIGVEIFDEGDGEFLVRVSELFTPVFGSRADSIRVDIDEALRARFGARVRIEEN